MSAERLVKRLRAARRGLRIGGALAAALSLALAGAPAFAADLFSTDWTPTAKSQARLIAGGGDLAGFEIALAPGAITYWRDPGDAGLPPTLDFSASDNVASVEVRVSRAQAHQRGRRRRSVRLRRRRRLSLAGQTSRPDEAGDAQAQRRFRRVRESVPAGQGASYAQASLRSGLASSPARSTPLSRPRRAPLRRRISARSRRSARIAGASARPMRMAPRATCLSRRRRAGG